MPSIKPAIKRKRALRMRVFAGPNGSGKSTIIQAVREYRIKEIPIDFGIYINADDIVQLLRNQKFNFLDYKVHTTRKELSRVAVQSGLIGGDHTCQCPDPGESKRRNHRPTHLPSELKKTI